MVLLLLLLPLLLDLHLAKTRPSGAWEFLREPPTDPNKERSGTSLSEETGIRKKRKPGLLQYRYLKSQHKCICTSKSKARLVSRKSNKNIGSMINYLRSTVSHTRNTRLAKPRDLPRDICQLSEVGTERDRKTGFFSTVRNASQKLRSAMLDVEWEKQGCKYLGGKGGVQVASPLDIGLRREISADVGGKTDELLV